MKLPNPSVQISDKRVLDHLQHMNKVLPSVINDAQNGPKASILLASPNGSVYSVKVSDAGVLSTTLEYQA